MREKILDISKKLYHNHLTPEIATDIILELLKNKKECMGFHNTDFSGKCFKCGEQVFTREEHH